LGQLCTIEPSRFIASKRYAVCEQPTSNYSFSRGLSQASYIFGQPNSLFKIRTIIHQVRHPGKGARCSCTRRCLCSKRIRYRRLKLQPSVQPPSVPFYHRCFLPHPKLCTLQSTRRAIVGDVVSRREGEPRIRIMKGSRLLWLDAKRTYYRAVRMRETELFEG
jgi:hypothetical protein